MKRKKITAIMAVIMMAAGLSACSQSNAKLEGKSGIVFFASLFCIKLQKVFVGCCTCIL